MDIKNILERHFDIEVIEYSLIGEGYDSKAYLVNNEYIFKIKFSANKKKGYEKEKRVYDFLNENLVTNIKIPNIEYSHISDEISILGYKQIKGKFLSLELYETLSNEEKQLLKQDIARFLKQMHDLDITEIKDYTIDNKQNVLEEYQLLRDTIYDSLLDIEKEYIEKFMKRLHSTTIFDDKKCLCHNDFSCNHLLLDENNRLCGIIDFGDGGVTDEYTDFIYLLENSKEEIGHEFGDDIINLYGDINIEKAKEYQDITEQYYPIETIVYGVKNNKPNFIDEGRKEIHNRFNNYLKENNYVVYLKVPTIDELHYRKKWMLDKQTMDYNAGYDIALKGYNYQDGTIVKSDAEMIEWYNKWINKEPDKYFAYIYAYGISEPIGEIYYYLDNNVHDMGVVIASPYRGKGYSYYALLELEKIAFEKNSISELSDFIPLDRIGAIKAFKKAGFIHTDSIKKEMKFNEEEVSRQLLITKEDYKKRR